MKEEKKNEKEGRRRKRNERKVEQTEPKGNGLFRFCLWTPTTRSRMRENLHHYGLRLKLSVSETLRFQSAHTAEIKAGGNSWRQSARDMHACDPTGTGFFVCSFENCWPWSGHFLIHGLFRFHSCQLGWHSSSQRS